MNHLGEQTKKQLQIDMAKQVYKCLDQIATMRSADIPSKAMREGLIESTKILTDTLVKSLESDTTKS